MSRGNQITRQWRLLRLIEGRKQGLRATELHEQLDCQVSERTIFRDLQHLQDAGFPLYEEGGRWRALAADEGGYAVPVHSSELLALLLSEELLAPMRSTEVVGALAALREKVAAMLHPAGRSYAEELKNHLIATLLGPGDYGESDAVRVVEEAIHQQHRVHVSYWTPDGSTTERDVDPYMLWYADGRLYLVGWCHLRGGVRTFLIDRLRRVEILDIPFDADPGFDPHAFTGSGLGAWTGERTRVELELSPLVAHLASERRFHPSQQVTTHDNGSAILTMYIAGLPHVAAWVASFGGRIIVRSPPRLIEMVRDLHRAGLAAHGDAPEQ